MRKYAMFYKSVSNILIQVKNYPFKLSMPVEFSREIIVVHDGNSIELKSLAFDPDLINFL